MCALLIVCLFLLYGSLQGFLALLPVRTFIRERLLQLVHALDKGFRVFHLSFHLTDALVRLVQRGFKLRNASAQRSDVFGYSNVRSRVGRLLWDDCRGWHFRLSGRTGRRLHHPIGRWNMWLTVVRPGRQRRRLTLVPAFCKKILYAVF